MDGVAHQAKRNDNCTYQAGGSAAVRSGIQLAVVRSGRLVVSHILMTLLAAAQSLGLIELAGVSWINIYSLDTFHVAEFTMALLLPFRDPRLAAKLRTGEAGFWPDQTRLLQSQVPIRSQILELHKSRMLGSLAVAKIVTPGDAQPCWIIQTRAGTREERMSWLRSVMEIEGRLPAE